MSKITKTTRVYLTIEVEEPCMARHSWDWATQGRSSMKQVNLLLLASGLSNLGNVDCIVESPTVCSFCGEKWDDDPACCNAAVDEWIAEHPAETEEP